MYGGCLLPQSHTGGVVVQQSREGADARRGAADGAVDAESKRTLAGGGGVIGGEGARRRSGSMFEWQPVTALIVSGKLMLVKATGAVMGNGSGRGAATRWSCRAGWLWQLMHGHLLAACACPLVQEHVTRNATWHQYNLAISRVTLG